MPTDVAASLPQLDLRDGTVITVTADDPAAIITSLVIHGWQEVGGLPLASVTPLLAQEPGAVAALNAEPDPGGPGGT